MHSGDSVTPEDAFAALGSERRVSILRILATAEEGGATATAFSEIYERIDIDSTSQLAYHLDKLDDVFVRKAGEGYVLTQAGDRVVRAIRSGTYTHRPRFERTTLEGHCPTCGPATLTAAFRDPFLPVECDACGTAVVTYDLPPAESNDRTAMEVLQACDRRVHHEYAMAIQGSCPLCSGSTDVSVRQHDRGDESRWYCVARCEQCSNQVYAPIEVRLISHPSVVSLYWAHGVDVTSIPFWEIRASFECWETEVLATDPFQCQVTVRYQGDERRLRLDESLHVTVLNEKSPAPID